MCRRIVGAREAIHAHRRRRFVDHDRRGAALIGVVGPASERPARRAPRRVGEARAEGQAAARRGQIAGHADDYAARPVRRCIVATRVAAHGDRRRRFVHRLRDNSRRASCEAGAAAIDGIDIVVASVQCWR